MVDAGLITMASFISPYRAERQMARDLLEDSEFIEIFVNTPLDVAEARDVKGSKPKALAGCERIQQLVPRNDLCSSASAGLHVYLELKIHSLKCYSNERCKLS